ncbi:hypothetical protein [Pandoraea anhela]|uniref:Uncharacterized protein n=1 Tax=Pandoraea anhela TaxID=2508295 RepID=A0A5E4Z3A8_9BURK|nr:hypothetical protein [Pandoraea anhela]VVE54623.1 hypothetical protein PAN31108_04944 [Pandoraea anhela]
MEQPFKVDTSAVVAKKRDELLAEFERVTRLEQERRARKQEHLDLRLKYLEQRISKRVEEVERFLNGTDEPELLAKWLLLDSWTRDQAIPLILGLEPCSEQTRVARRKASSASASTQMITEAGEFLDIGLFRTLSGFSLWSDYSDLIPSPVTRLKEYCWETNHYYDLLNELWDSGEHPERPSPSYFLAWASGKGIEPSWFNWASEKGMLAGSADRADLPSDGPKLLGREKATLQKQLAALALLLSEKAGKYQRGGKLNVKQVADSIEEVIAALPNADDNGLSSSSIRANIKSGLDLLTK